MSKFSIIGLNPLNGVSLGDLRSHFSQFGAIVTSNISEGVKAFPDGRWVVEYGAINSALKAYNKCQGKSSELLFGIGQGPFKLYFGTDVKKFAKMKDMKLPLSKNDPTAAFSPKAPRPAGPINRSGTDPRASNPTGHPQVVKTVTPKRIKPEMPSSASTCSESNTSRPSSNVGGGKLKKTKLVRRKPMLETASLLAIQVDTRDPVSMAANKSIRITLGVLRSLQSHALSSFGLSRLFFYVPFTQIGPTTEDPSVSTPDQPTSDNDPRPTPVQLRQLRLEHDLKTMNGDTAFVSAMYRTLHPEHISPTTSLPEDAMGTRFVFNQSLSYSNTGKLNSPLREQIENEAVTRLLMHTHVVLDGNMLPHSRYNVFRPSFMKKAVPKETLCENKDDTVEQIEIIDR